jgi:hypothetical protein
VFGFAVEQEGRFTWAIPLLRETRRAADPERAAKELVEELAKAPARDGDGSVDA